MMRIHKPISELCGGTDEHTIGGNISLPVPPSKVTLSATYRGVEVDHFELFGKGTDNLRLAILQQICGDAQAFLSDTRDHKFESRVDILLNLLGFSPAHYGGTNLEAPDILAFPNVGNWVLVVECTERDPDLANKLTKLATRTKIVSKTAESLTAYPIIVTAFERSMLNLTDKEKAGKERIAVITADEMPNLFQMALEGPDPIKVREYLLQLIPYVSN
jgi:hypothetical protein